MRQLLRRAIAHVAPPESQPGVRVLLYHSIDDRDDLDRMALRVRRDRFLEQMALLRREGYHVVPLAQVFDRPEGGCASRIAITFDDGYQSVEWAAGVLHDFGFPATFFVVPSFVDGMLTPSAYWEQWGYLGWPSVRALSEAGFEVGAHSLTHPDLRRCADDELHVEIGRSKAVLEERLGREVVSFSYPFGRHDARVRSAVEDAGYRLACASRYGQNRQSGPRFAICRTEIAGTDTVRDFRSKLLGKYDWLRHWQDLRQSA